MAMRRVGVLVVALMVSAGVVTVASTVVSGSVAVEDKTFKRPSSFLMAPRTRPSTRECLSLKVAQDC